MKTLAAIAATIAGLVLWVALVANAQSEAQRAASAAGYDPATLRRAWVMCAKGRAGYLVSDHQGNRAKVCSGGLMATRITPLAH